MAFGSDHAGPHVCIEGLCRNAQGWLLACGGTPGVGQGGADGCLYRAMIEL